MQHTILRNVLGFGLMSSMAAARLAGQEHQHPPDQPTSEASATPLYHNLGTLHHEITTRSEVAQKYFDQGLRLTYAFNHDEAIKSFKQGLQHDSTCAMCFWGIAYALGPNINVPMDTSAVRPAYEAVQSAMKYAGAASPRERAYIEALGSATRPTPPPAGRRSIRPGPKRSAWSPMPIPRTMTRPRSMLRR
jgi:hypothetical protein